MYKFRKVCDCCLLYNKYFSCSEWRKVILVPIWSYVKYLWTYFFFLTEKVDVYFLQVIIKQYPDNISYKRIGFGFIVVDICVFIEELAGV